jgi:SAM-dependent MidA family methyltransferase
VWSLGFGVWGSEFAVRRLRARGQRGGGSQCLSRPSSSELQTPNSKLQTPVSSMTSWIADITRAEGGKISFERYMELALYDPDHGYYTRHISGVGPSADFATALTIGDALVRSIANWTRAEARQLELSKLNIIELGGGGGQLARGILRTIRPWERVHYQIVEVSSPLQKRQEKALRGRRISWRKTIESALDAAGGQAILIAHEFVDAFPCRRFERAIEGWREIILSLDADLWREQLGLCSETVESSAFSIQCAAGQRIETLGSYRRWLTNMAPLLHRGALLTIDYGDLPAEIYRRKPRGTARAFFRHQRLQGMEVYLRPGHQDLTADVNFLDLRNWGEALGLATVEFVNQAEFIRRWGGSERKRSRSNAANDYLSGKEAMGSAIKVLHQRKTRTRPNSQGLEAGKYF